MTEETKDDGIIPVPECLKDLAIKLAGVSNTMDRYIDKRWGYKKARRASIERQALRVEFWSKFFKIKPELKNKSLSVNVDYMEITEEKKQ